MKGLPIGDIRLIRDKVITCPIGSVLIPPICRKTVKIGGSAGSLSIQPINKYKNIYIVFIYYLQKLEQLKGIKIVAYMNTCI